jgi:uncharacterized protein (DUF58 family)
LAEESIVYATHRTRLTAIVIFFILLTGFLSSRIQLITIGLVTLSLILGMRAYVSYMAASLRDLEVEFEHDPPLDGGEFEVRVVLRNRGIIPLGFVEYNLRHSPFIKFSKGATRGFIILPARSETIIRLICSGRVGRHRIGPVEIQARDIFGLYRTRTFKTGSIAYVKIPPSYSVAVLRRLMVYARSLGLSRSRASGTGIEFHSMREYRPGDELKRVEWRKSVKFNKLIVKLTEREAQQNVYILLDSSHVMLSGPYARTVFEHMARAVTAIIAYLSQRGDNFQLIIFGGSEMYGTPSLMRAARGFRVSIENISSVNFEEIAPGDRVEGLMSAYKFLLRTLRRERNIVIIITVIDSQKYLEALIKISKELIGLRNIVYIVDPIITSYDMVGLPVWARGLYTLKTYGILRNQLNYSRILNKEGVNTVLVSSLDAPFKIARLIELHRSR